MGYSAEPTLKDQVSTILKQSTGKTSFEGEFQTLINLGPKIVPEIISCFNDSSRQWENRFVCAQVLGHFESSQSYEALKKGTQDQLFLIRLAALKGLQKHTHPETAKLIENLLSDKALVVRSEAATILGLRRETRSIERLSQELFEPRNFHREKSLWSREEIIRAFGQIGSSLAVPTLIKTLQEQESNIRQAACQALSQIEPEASVEKAVGDKCWESWMKWDQCQKNETDCKIKKVQTVGRPSI